MILFIYVMHLFVLCICFLVWPMGKTKTSRGGRRGSLTGPCRNCQTEQSSNWRNGPPSTPIICTTCHAAWERRGSLDGYTPGGRVALTGPCRHCGRDKSCRWRSGPPGAPIICAACYNAWKRCGSLDGYTFTPRRLSGPCRNCQREHTSQWYCGPSDDTPVICRSCYDYQYKHGSLPGEEPKVPKRMPKRKMTTEFDVDKCMEGRPVGLRPLDAWESAEICKCFCFKSTPWEKMSTKRGINNGGSFRLEVRGGTDASSWGVLECGKDLQKKWHGPKSSTMPEMNSWMEAQSRSVSERLALPFAHKLRVSFLGYDGGLFCRNEPNFSMLNFHKDGRPGARYIYDFPLKAGGRTTFVLKALRTEEQDKDWFKSPTGEDDRWYSKVFRYGYVATEEIRGVCPVPGDDRDFFHGVAVEGPRMAAMVEVEADVSFQVLDSAMRNSLRTGRNDATTVYYDQVYQEFLNVAIRDSPPFESE